MTEELVSEHAQNNVVEGPSEPLDRACPPQALAERLKSRELLIRAGLTPDTPLQRLPPAAPPAEDTKG